MRMLADLNRHIRNFGHREMSVDDVERMEYRGDGEILCGDGLRTGETFRKRIGIQLTKFLIEALDGSVVRVTRTVIIGGRVVPARIRTG